MRRRIKLESCNNEEKDNLVIMVGWETQK